MGRVTVPAPSQVGLQAVFHNWTGSFAELPAWGGRKLGLIIRQGHRLCFARGQGCRAGSTAGQEYGLGSKGAQAHCSGCLVMQGQRWYFTAH